MLPKASDRRSLIVLVHPMPRAVQPLSLMPACVALALACAAPSPSAPPNEGASESTALGEASGASARWSYEIRLDDTLDHMQLALCIEGPRPLRLRASEEAMPFVDSARVRGGPALVPSPGGDTFEIETLGEHGCLDFEIDLSAAIASGGRDCMRRDDTLLIAPDRWLWFPAKVPKRVDARARFILPEGVHATVPWPERDDGWRQLEHSAFGWNAWLSIGRYEPLHFDLGDSHFEVAVFPGAREASDAGVVEWLETAAGASVELFGAFPRGRVSVVVIPMPAWGDAPVLFGVARRGGGGSVMLLLDEQARDEELPGEWVATHELLHLGMPYIDAPWMSEGFVTYYTDVLRARQGVLTEGDPAAQTKRALEKLASGFHRGRGGIRTLASASENMRRVGGYTRVYWGGAALAFDLDVSLRHASANRRSLDDLMVRMTELAPLHRFFSSAELITLMDEELATWRAAGELEAEISIGEIIDRHLESKSIPKSVEFLERLALDRAGSKLILRELPRDQAQVRDALFGSVIDSP